MTRKRFPNDHSLPDDTPAMAKAIATLKDHDIAFIRTSIHQLKIGEWNFYPNRGTLVRDDGSAAETERGLDALLARLGHDDPTHPLPKIESNNPEPPRNNMIILADLIRPSGSK
jgi:hypothetical protein